ncbi:OmpH family outer membrane protein [Meiothermus sp. QL-1]|uniref:OmpH family outer membrane protein n=1 Tax=Meiothermus sp. QL-1 TaxID=2058095 RepID=UPI000E0AE4D2|nr:OmpH family outer membrane protein [Meiothermus sp. QL-1]RDI94823.1 OmpH family outer membrane protein [Meiothermus sp. QL-1]
MERFPLLAPSLAGLLLSGLLMAQDRPTAEKIGYLNVQAAVEAHPQFARVRALQAQAEGELRPLQAQLQALEGKIAAGSASQSEQQAYLNLAQQFQAAAQKWKEQGDALLMPINQEVERVLGQIAQQQGFALVLDQNVAARSGLVVYAESSLDLTPAVLAALPKP